MPTTTNFGWTTPADTDLVKDGAAAIRTALGGVDTSFVDLKGGTTGQVLSKASGTDLDFTWVASSAAPGLVHLNTTTGTGVTSISIGSNASPLFSTTYDNYKIIVVCDSDNTESSVSFRLRANTTDLTSAVYNNQNVGGADTTAFAQRSLSATSGKVMDNHTSDYTNITEILLTNPFNSRNKAFVSNSMSTRNTLAAIVNNGYVADTSSYNGITFLSPHNINNATIYVYGLAK